LRERKEKNEKNIWKTICTWDANWLITHESWQNVRKKENTFCKADFWQIQRKRRWQSIARIAINPTQNLLYLHWRKWEVGGGVTFIYTDIFRLNIFLAINSQQNETWRRRGSSDHWTMELADKEHCHIDFLYFGFVWVA